MMITTTEHSKWTISDSMVDTKGIEMSFKERKQTIRGFGGCFNELAAICLNELSSDDKNKVLDAFFSPEGCNFNFNRMAIGANDFSEMWYSYNETEGDYAMEQFSITHDYKYILPFIREAQKRQGDCLQIYASPWSPPAWMKFPKVYNYGKLVQTDENLKAYALYLRKFIEAYREEGINITQLHIQNEFSSDTKYPSCMWTGEEARNFISNYLADALNGITDIWLGTINCPRDGEAYSWTRYHNCANYVLQDETCRKVIKGVSYQWEGKFAVGQTHADYPELELIQSESECGNGKNTWTYAMYIFELMNHYFRNGASAYVYWNFALKTGGQSTWGWHQNSLVTIENGVFTYNPEFYLMKHLSHFIKRGAKYIELSGAWTTNSIAFENPDGSKIIVCMNPFNEDKVITFEKKNYLLPPRSFNTITL